MAQTQKYNHITVTANADDDIVIRAGAKRSFEDPSISVDSFQSHQESESRSEDLSSDDDVAPVAVKNPTSAPRSESKHAPSADVYRPTSLEDIESSKMPKAQIIVIVLAILAIAAFVIWYVFFS